MKIAILGCGNIGSKVLSILKDKSCKIKFIVGNPSQEIRLITWGKKYPKKQNVNILIEKKF